jgi:hypothetical protein
MAGILNNKTRIMDVIVTAEGKRQLGRGNFRPEFASFSDKDAFYESDTLSGSTDARDRILFEATSLPADKIFLEYDDSGRLLGSPDVKLNAIGLNGGIFSRDDNGNFNLSSANDFADHVQTMITGAIDNIRKHKLLASYNPNDRNSFEFDISRNKIEFIIDNFKPFGKHPSQKEATLGSVDTFLTDEKMTHLPHFKFLPPVRDDGEDLGKYIDINEREITNFDQLMQELGPLPSESYDLSQQAQDLSIFGPLEDAFVNAALSENNELGKPRETIKFNNTTLSNNMFGQCFEVSIDGGSRYMNKLQVIDFGTFIDENDKNRPEKHVFFVGKTYRGVGRLPAFLNLFTLIFD